MNWPAICIVLVLDSHAHFNWPLVRQPTVISTHLCLLVNGLYPFMIICHDVGAFAHLCLPMIPIPLSKLSLVLYTYHFPSYNVFFLLNLTPFSRINQTK
jgi:hypothetical protein